ncbi:MAG TPA: hypothetical protein VFU38_03540 [Candidatus Krumholzibacteria bacterium]|nr:hypothetical protein [Candidatus Krumholzibacteria bacterium]
MIVKTLHALLHTIVDYAGLFPPASLSMTEAVRNYSEYRRDMHSWMLARFVVPVARLDELVETPRGAEETGHWKLSALVGEDVAGDAARIAEFNRRGQAMLVDAAEVKASSVDTIARAALSLPRDVKTYIEIPLGGDLRPLIASIAGNKLRAKMRTGGVVPEAIPPLEHVAQFLRECYALGVPFKATAGLHHPLCSERPLTYAADSPRATMHGFLNVFLTAAFQYNGLTRADALELLALPSLDGLALHDHVIEWKDYFVTLQEVSTVRRRSAIAFGSCSFREPVDELKELGLLP